MRIISEVAEGPGGHHITKVKGGDGHRGEESQFKVVGSNNITQFQLPFAKNLTNARCFTYEGCPGKNPATKASIFHIT